MDLARLQDIAADSDGIVYIMAILLLIALTVIIERSWYLHRAIRRGKTLSRTVAAMPEIDGAALAALASNSRPSPHVALLDAARAFPDPRDPDRLSGALEEAVMWQAPHVDRHIWLLDTIVTLAPLLGLLGTIIGMFNTFQVLGTDNTAPAQITGGVAEALVATACGLFIAILGLLGFNSLNDSVRLVIHQMEMLKVMLVNRLAPAAAPIGEPHAAQPRSLRVPA